MEEHKRRVRYSGKYPKHFNEKYKELNPEKYEGQQEKVMEKGITPAGTHIPIMVNEILNVLNIHEGEIGIDCTLGYGGHTEKFLEKLNEKGHLYSLDIDSIEIEKTKQRLNSLGYPSSDNSILSIEYCNFRDLDLVLEENEKANFLLADLGVSSMQIDNPSRGFTFKENGPLDLRLDPNSPVTASMRLMELSKQEIVHMLEINSDEPYAKEISEKIVERKSKGPILYTKELYKIVKEALNFLPREGRNEIVKKTCQRVFQALRIDINTELESLEELMRKLPLVMAPNGRMAVLTFHSGEDRIVKKYFKKYFEEGIFLEISKDVIRATSEECYNNPRAKSAKLRYAIRK